MCYMERGLGSRGLACFFSLCCVGASLGGGNMVQANSIATALEHSFGWDRLAVGVVTAALTGLVILGGIGRIGAVSEKLVPAMALLFISGSAVVLAVNASALPGALESIVTEALTPSAAVGGGLGYGVARAMRYGVARGVFTNEAGLGSAAFAYDGVEGRSPEELGCLGIFQVFADTLLMCTVTGLCILVCRSPVLEGAALTFYAYESALGPWGGRAVSLCTALFAAATLTAWCGYGREGLFYLTGGRGKNAYALAAAAAAALGCCLPLGEVLRLGDAMNGLMALPNLAALFLLRRKVAVEK